MIKPCSDAGLLFCTKLYCYYHRLLRRTLVRLVILLSIFEVLNIIEYPYYIG